MKIICKDKVIDLSKFESVSYRESLLGSCEGYPVEVIRLEARATIKYEIMRFKDKELAEKLTRAIADNWAEGAEFFDVEKWLCKALTGGYV